MKSALPLLLLAITALHAEESPKAFINGTEVSGGNNCSPATGFICLESEGSPIIFRNLRLRVLP
jgi:hypothetical protein